jgi:hypothetical protein
LNKTHTSDQEDINPPNKLTMAGTYTHYNGNLSDIPESASPGLRFLQKYITAIDSLDQASPVIVLDQLILPTTTFATNGGDPAPAKQVQQMFSKRAEMLSDFSHSKFPIDAFDLKGEDGKRTVTCECASM